MAPSPPPCPGAQPRNVDKNLPGGSTAALQPDFANGYDMASRFNTDGLGNTYIGIVIAWTCLLLPAAIFLIRHRKLPYLRMRNIPLAISAVATLHVYWVLCMIAYVLNGYFPCATEYWIMSIYLPLGIALFHATNSQLLSIATAQKRYVQSDVLSEPSRQGQGPAARGWRKWWQRLKTYNATKNTIAWIGMGMVVQVSVTFWLAQLHEFQTKQNYFKFVFTLIVFLMSRKFHPSFGITGVVTTRTGCRRGWEWWPSIAWQLFWSWAYAPVLLWRVRGIDDVHGWRSQTIACIIAGMPASPMWLIALYAPPMKAVNRYFVPPLWFSASIVIMQACVIFVPFFQIFKNRKLETETREIIAEWEEKQKQDCHGSSSFMTLTSSSTKIGSGARSRSRHSIKSNGTNNSRQGEMYTMSALEKTLQVNPTPLLMFSALKDFSGENISFLIHVRQWKADWISSTTTTTPPRSGFRRKQDHPPPSLLADQALMRHQFQQAVGIYASFVSLKYSDFPINISSTHLRELEAVFEQYATLVCAEPASNAATPFDNYWSSSTVSEDRDHDLESRICGKGEAKCEGEILELSSVASTVVSSGGGGGGGGEGCGAGTTNVETPLKSDPQLPELKMTNYGDRLPSTIGIPDAFGPAVFDRAEQSIKELVLTNTWPKFVKAGFAQQNNTVKRDGFAARLQAAVRACRRRLPRVGGGRYRN
ncbi:hypothetical protein HRR95_005709 [Exophiala dermatitidis]|nr:hypothetical protein HRR75_004667 [Exophiala dermatitidis]KAJ4545931.1 hypothetical protein HRR78_005770 [Exophiala dermatitidis]KAJ4674581.1 hypothetical protein HRR95_005709 [Exophiala dermatitidis]